MASTYDDHLSEEGIKQVRLLAAKMSQKGIQKIFSSPLIRARETATILADSIDCSVETVDDLKERNQYGILAGIKKKRRKSGILSLLRI